MTDAGEMNFETFVLSLGTATLVSLGEIDNPVTRKQEKNLDSAKQHINILEILAKKTVGNLSESENRLLQQILYEVRLKYVAQTSGSEKK